MMTVLLSLSRALLALVLIGAGAAKLGDRAGTGDAMLGFGVPARLVPLLVWLLPAAELLIGIALVPATTAWWGAAGALVLFILFLGAIGWNLARGRRPDCRCFGQLQSAPIGWKIVLRNLVLVGLAGVILAEPAQPLGPGLFGWFDVLTIGEGVALGLALAACALAAAEAWLLSNLMQQNGRLILRLDALDARLEGEALPPRAPGRETNAAASHLGLPVGKEAPAFALPDLAGRVVSLNDLRARGRAVLLLFMDPECGPCRTLMPDLATWRREHEPKLTVVMLSRGTVEDNRARIAGHDVGTVLLQAADEVAERYQALGTPSAVLVDERGTMASPIAQGAEAIRRLVSRATEQPKTARPKSLARPGPVPVGIALLAAVALSTAAVSPPDQSQTREAPTWELQVQSAAGWQTWWRADSAPAIWHEPVQAVLDATRWQTVATGVDLGELVISGGGIALRTRIVMARFDLRRHRMLLVQPRSQAVGQSTWTIDSANARAVLAFNAGQFRDEGVWGWLLREGREVQAPGRGPLSMAVAVTADGEALFVSPDSLPVLRAAGGLQEAFQSYPALLVDDARVPARLRDPGRLVNLAHRDSRLALCTLGDGRLLVALTRFDNLGRIFGSLPIGLTLDESAAVMGALGCRRAVSLDGGLSGQLLVRPDTGSVRRWEGWRAVPLGIEIVPRP